MKPIYRFAFLTSLLFVAACARQVPLTYAPTHPISPVANAVTVDRVITADERHEADPTWIGAVRGGYGNPLKVLHTPAPLSDIVTRAFRDALQARGLLAPEGAGRFDIAVAIEQFESTQYARREANVDLLVAVKSRNTGQEVYRDRVKVDLVTGSIFALDTGAFGSSDDLQAVAQTALNQAIDQALDKPGFRAALQQQAVPTV